MASPSHPGSSSTTRDTYEHCTENIGHVPKEKPTTRKVGNLKDSFEYAPKKPDGDHWQLLIEPLMNKDKAQCDIWKEEVSNLLIFAGLFSAVVTAFIVESYKTLQRDSTDVMINLLLQIVDRLGDSSNSTSVSSQPSSSLPAFSPTDSAIRINVFWFISLVLSLTTVLVGIVSLQWLREHQNYTNLTPRQQYAILNMRNKGLEKWHVRNIFTAMPLFLQSVLVLFFAGIIDFLSVFGHIAVVIPVTIVIGLTLLFLVATTLFPTLQGFSLFFNFSFSGGYRDVPVQCPYKSPQSDAVRAISLLMFTLLHILHPRIHAISQTIRRWFVGGSSLSLFLFLPNLFRLMNCVSFRLHQWLEGLIRDSNWPAGSDGTFLKHVVYSDRSWIDFDLTWLEIRDGFMRRAFNRPLDHYDRLEQNTGIFRHLPVWDILQGLISQTHPDISSAYHAFAEVSDTTLSESDSNSNAYLYDVVAIGGLDEPDICFSDFYKGISKNLNAKLLAKYQALFTFLFITSSPDWDTISLHMDELQLRLIQYLYVSKCLVRDDKQQGPLPVCLIPIPGLYERSSLLALLPQFAQVTTTLFEEISRQSPSHSLINVPCARRDGIRQGMKCFGLLFSAERTEAMVMQKISSILELVNAKLVQEISTVVIPAAGGAKASLLFYAAALFVHGSAWVRYSDLTWAWPPSSFKTLLYTIHKYKNLITEMGMSDPDIEKDLANPLNHNPSTFLAGWWSFLEIHAPSSSSILYNGISDGDGQPVHPDISNSGPLPPSTNLSALANHHMDALSMAKMLEHGSVQDKLPQLISRTEVGLSSINTQSQTPASGNKVEPYPVEDEGHHSFDTKLPSDLIVEQNRLDAYKVALSEASPSLFSKRNVNSFQTDNQSNADGSCIMTPDPVQHKPADSAMVSAKDMVRLSRSSTDVGV